MELSLEDILPKNLKNMLVDLLKDNKLLNYRIFGGEYTFISLKFESPRDSSSHVEAVKHGIPSKQVFKRKSQCTVDRDSRRLADWQSGTVLPKLNSDVNVDIVNSMKTEVDEAGNDLDMSGCIKIDSHDDSGIVNSTMKITEQSHYAQPPVYVDKEMQFTSKVDCHTTSSQTFHADSQPDGNTQTDVPAAQDIMTQTDPYKKNKKMQTKTTIVPSFPKGIQTIPNKGDSATQTSVVFKCMKNKIVMTDKHRTVEKSIGTEPPADKHIQTFAPPIFNKGFQVSPLYEKSTQTESKRAMKQALQGRFKDPESDQPPPSCTETDFKRCFEEQCAKLHAEIQNSFPIKYSSETSDICTRPK